MINARLPGTARTLAMTLRARSDEQNQDKKLLDDPWSAEWYTYLPKFDDYEKWYNPAFQLATVIRSRLIDDAVKRFIEAHDKPLVVELGAGLSTRYYRIGEGKTHWVEVDTGTAISLREKFEQSKVDHWMLPADLTSENWYDGLPDYDAKNTLFIAEGVLMFIESEDVADLFQELRGRYSGAGFVFDVVNPNYIEASEDDFKKLKSPIYWGVTEKELKDYGVKVDHTTYILLEYPDRWQDIGVDSKARTRDRSGYIVEATLKK